MAVRFSSVYWTRNETDEKRDVSGQLSLRPPSSQHLLRAAPIKRTAVERQVNTQIVFLFGLLLALSIGSTIGSSIRSWFVSSQQWYLIETTNIADRGTSFCNCGAPE